MSNLPYLTKQQKLALCRSVRRNMRNPGTGDYKAALHWGNEIAENWFLLNSVFDGSLGVEVEQGADGHADISVIYESRPC